MAVVVLPQSSVAVNVTLLDEPHAGIVIAVLVTDTLLSQRSVALAEAVHADNIALLF
jgi:hypothetical protein